MIPPDALGNGATRVLLAVIDMHRREGRVTVRGIMGRSGHKSTATVFRHLENLADEGLVTSEVDKHATTRPLVDVCSVLPSAPSAG